MPLQEMLDLYKAKGLEEPNFQQRLNCNGPNQRYQAVWEVCFASFLLDKGFKLVRPPKNQGGFEYFIKVNGKKVWFECTAPTRGKEDPVAAVRDTDAVDDFEECVWSDDNQRKTTLRITQCLSHKKNKHEILVQKNLIGKDDYSILAVNLYEAMAGWAIPKLNTMEQTLSAALYGTGCLQIDQYRRLFFEKDGLPLKKSNGALVPNNHFKSATFPFDAIFYSCASENAPNEDIKCIVNPRTGKEFRTILDIIQHSTGAKHG